MKNSECMFSCCNTSMHPLQMGYTPLHFAAIRDDTTVMKILLSTPGVDVNIEGEVSCFTGCKKSSVTCMCEGIG